MKSLIQAIAIAAALTVPAVSFAQSDAPVTRAEVKADLVQYEQAGGKVTGEDPYYPASTQAAVTREQGQETTAYGGVASNLTASGKIGRASNTSDAGTLYFGR
jgi:Domain of unknown function (DUF4148)